MNNKYQEQIKELMKELTLEEKVSLLSGKDFWSTKPIYRLKIDSLYLTDGPHGVRKQSTESDELSLQIQQLQHVFQQPAAVHVHSILI